MCYIVCHIMHEIVCYNAGVFGWLVVGLVGWLVGGVGGTVYGRENRIITLHSALAEIERGTELFVGDSKCMLIDFWEGVVGCSHVGGKVCADEFRGG